jgi:hypothetical protein
MFNPFKSFKQFKYNYHVNLDNYSNKYINMMQLIYEKKRTMKYILNEDDDTTNIKSEIITKKYYLVLYNFLAISLLFILNSSINLL